MLWTTVGFSVVNILESLSAEIFYMDSKYTCDNPDFRRPEHPCFPPRITADPRMARIVQAVLTFVAIMTLNLLVLLWRSSSGVYSDPSSIASIASLLHHPEVLDDFRSLDPEASEKQMKDHIGYKQYKLQDYQSYDGTWRYGITPVEPAVPGMVQHHSPPNFGLPSKKKLPILETCIDVFIGLAMTAILGVIVAYMMDSSKSSFNNFLNSNTFGPRFIMVRIIFHDLEHAL